MTIIMFVSAIASTAVLVAIGFIYGILTVLCIISVPLIAAVAVAARPIRDSRRLLAGRPPRKMYEDISSSPSYCRLENLPPLFTEAVICCEDPRFFSHKGVDLECMFIAVANNLLTSRKPIGASTITMQLIKNLYLTPKVSYKRKMTEILMAGKVEKDLTKKEILELYVNIIYYGYGKYGITDAAAHYYGVKPSGLSPDQCISLAAILSCPDKYNKAANPKYFEQVKKNAVRSLFIHSDALFPMIKIEP